MSRRKKISVPAYIDIALDELGIQHVSEYKFVPDRKWRFDFAIPEKKIAFEAEGAVFTRGRHTRGMGFSKDCSKYNRAAIEGWRVLRYTEVNVHQIYDDMKILKLDKAGVEVNKGLRTNILSGILGASKPAQEPRTESRYPNAVRLS